MNDLTEILLYKNNNYDIEEFTKQGQELLFDSGIEQRITKYSIQAIEVQISYTGLNFLEYRDIRNSYENNHSNTFIVEFNRDTFNPEDPYYVEPDYIVKPNDYVLGEKKGNNNFIDLRDNLMTKNSAVWGFKEFKFEINARDLLYTGTITLVSSVFFNFPQYQNLFSQSSSYTISSSTDYNFLELLESVSPFKCILGYTNNSIFSNIGQSLRHARNKGGLKRAWTYSWLIDEQKLIRLLTFYRKKSGIMGTFGLPDFGTDPGQILGYMEPTYIINQDDYVQSSSTSNVSNVRFLQDSFKYTKRIDGLYTAEVDFIEVKNG